MNLALIWQGAQRVCGVQVPSRSSKSSLHVRVRWLAMATARERGNSFGVIGQFFNMDHTSVMHAVKNFDKLEMQREVAELKAYLELKNPDMEMGERLAR